jgi:two-component system response regulator NreC
MTTLKILVADDHAVVREGVRAVLETQGNVQVVGDASDGIEAVEKSVRFEPHVVLMDITMPGKNGVEATREIKSRRPNTHVLILTMHDSEDYFFQALNAGASGYLPKETSPSELVEALHTVSMGGVHISPFIAQRLAADYVKRAEAGENNITGDELSTRENEVMQLIAEGNTNREIAERLYLSVNTVKTHRLNMMKKLNLNNKADLIKYAIRKGIVPLDA